MDTKSIIHRTRLTAWLGGALLLGSLALTGCGGGGGSSTRVEGIYITPNGGQIGFPALAGFTNKVAPFVQLDTQAGVVSSGVKISVVSNPQPAALLPSTVSLPPGLIAVTDGAYKFTTSPAAVTFNNAVTLTLAYKPDTTNPTTYHIFTYDNGTWYALGNNFVNNGSAAQSYPYGSGISVPVNTVTAQFDVAGNTQNHISSSGVYVILAGTVPSPPTGLARPATIGHSSYSHNVAQTSITR